MVRKEWLSINVGTTSIERWQNKIEHLQCFLRGWTENLIGEYKKQRDKLLLLIDELDLKAESTLLSEDEIAAKKRGGCALSTVTVR